MEKNNNLLELIDKLPEPNTIEEQAMYALICALVDKKHEEPFNGPVKKTDQYWRALYLALKGVGDMYNDVPNKADKATTLDGYGIADAYSKKEVDKLVNKTDTYVIEQFVSDDGKSWYRKWSNGFLEQGIIFTGTWSSAAYRTINLLQPYRDTNYNVQISYIGSTTDSSPSTRALSANSKTTISFTNYISNGTKSFYICGYGE